MDELKEYLVNKYDLKFSPLEDETILDDFLDIRGQQGVDFVDDFFTHFNIKVDYFNYRKHIYSEGFGLINFGWFRKREKVIPLKYKDLKKALEQRVWQEDCE